MQSTHLALLVGVILVLGFFVGRSMKRFHMPMILGYMFTGIILGPSFLNISQELQSNLSFIVDLTLGMVAFSIGLELIFSELKSFGRSIIWIIISESFCAFFLVAIAMYLFTSNLALSLAFAVMAPASAPAGTVAVIQEYKARGKLTKALYAVVGFDDGLAIVLFGFVLAILNSIFSVQEGLEANSFWSMLLMPFQELAFSLLLALFLAFVLELILLCVKEVKDVLILAVGFVMISNSLCQLLHTSLILTNMLVGLFVANAPRKELKERVKEPLLEILPLLYILFFVLAGAHLQINKIFELNAYALIYICMRSLGLVGGAWIGASLGGAEKKIRKYLGLGILSQAGVAIGLSLALQKEFRGAGALLSSAEGLQTSGDFVGSSVLLTIVMTSLFFELLGPIFTKYALQQAGEIQLLRQESLSHYRKIIQKPQGIAAMAVLNNLVKNNH